MRGSPTTGDKRQRLSHLSQFIYPGQEGGGNQGLGRKPGIVDFSKLCVLLCSRQQFTRKCSKNGDPLATFPVDRMTLPWVNLSCPCETKLEGLVVQNGLFNACCDNSFICLDCGEHHHHLSSCYTSCIVRWSRSREERTIDPHIVHNGTIERLIAGALAGDY